MCGAGTAWCEGGGAEEAEKEGEGPGHSTQPASGPPAAPARR